MGGLVLGGLLTAVAWVYLVGAAIDFGVLALAGSDFGWLFTFAASVGAVVCLVLFLALVARLLRALGFLSEQQPRRAGTRRKGG